MPICIAVSRQGVDGVAARTCHYRFDAHEVLVGRSEKVDIRLPDTQVSLVHGRLRVSGSQLVYIDLNSTNGSWVNGQAAPVDEAIELSVGSHITIGPFQLVIVSEAMTDSPSTPRDTASLARQMVRDALRLIGGEIVPALDILSGSRMGTTHRLNPDSVTVLGRGEGCDLQLDDADASRRHAEVVNQDDGVRLFDLGSKNGVILNDVRIEDWTALEHGDVFRIGTTSIRFIDPAQATLQDLNWEQNASVAESSEQASRGGWVRSGELHYEVHNERALSAASAFELGAPQSVLPEVSAPPLPRRSRTSDFIMLGLGVLLVGVAIALIVYLVSY